MSQPPQTTAPSRSDPQEWVVGDVAEIRYKIFEFKGVWKVHFTGENINWTVQDVADQIARGVRDRESAVVDFLFRTSEGAFEEYMPLRMMKGRLLVISIQKRTTGHEATFGKNGSV